MDWYQGKAERGLVRVVDGEEVFFGEVYPILVFALSECIGMVQLF